MASSTLFVTDLTILAGQSTSQYLPAKNAFDDAVALYIASPSILDAGTYTIQTPYDSNDNPSIFNTLLSGDPPSDLAPPPAGKGRVYFDLASAPGFRISGPVAAADRVFKVYKQIDIEV